MMVQALQSNAKTCASMYRADVFDAPRIIDINSSAEITEGTQVAFVCVVDSNPVSRIMWLKEDVLLKEDYSQNLTLELEYVTFNHDGIYICVAENEHGRSNKSMGLAVMYAPWKPSVNASIIAIEGESVTIMCNTQGNPDPTISIIKDKQVLNSVIFENELVLEIPSVTHEHDGEYWCTAENPYGQSNSSFNLTVVFSPLFLPESKCSVSKDTIQCMCTVKSNPDPVIVFEIPERNLSLSELDLEFVHSQRNGYMVSSILTLQKDTGIPQVVLCIASNLYGRKAQELLFHDSSKLVWAKIGPVGAVVVFVILVAVGGYMIKTREKKNLTESSSFIQTETSTSHNGQEILGRNTFDTNGQQHYAAFLPGRQHDNSVRCRGEGWVRDDYEHIKNCRRNKKEGVVCPGEFPEVIDRYLAA
ncbi:myelin-associated glyco isoform X1 [Pelobates cultripes]|uniref:Myelin-associated glyco isoform X1 n=1 Tax=Pelobates cultripes TaxID=61616 RepID=A0AAD1WQH2_PELCU|nr:myelin-associated glyco isoform X1 [Pelobates cultripes]